MSGGAALDFFAGLAGAAGRGAALGAVAGPAGAAVAAGVAAVADLCDATGVTRWLFGAGADATKAAVVDAVTQATGTADLAAQGAALERDPEVAMKLRVALGQIAAAREQAADQARLDAFRAQLADVAGARAQTQALAAAGSAIAWGAPLVSALVLGTFGVVTVVAIVLISTRSLDPVAVNILTLVIGAQASLATAVTTYWVGSSAGSAQKSEQIERLTAKDPP